MHFVLEKVTSQGVRVGQLIFSSGRIVQETPMCLLYTRSGSAPHLIHEVLQDIPERPLAALMTLPTLYELPGAVTMERYKNGAHSFFSLKDHLLYLSIQDPSAPSSSSYNESGTTSVWTHSGRHKVSVKDYASFVESLCPNVYESLCDSASSINNMQKRVRKSVDRTLSFLDEMLKLRNSSKTLQECSLLGAIVGGDDVLERIRSTEETVKRPVDGFVIEGFDMEYSAGSSQAVLSQVNSLLPAGKPRFIHGMGSPADVFRAVENGVDVFDGAYPYMVTQRDSALVFHLCWALECKTVQHSMEINLGDERFAEDFTPLVEGCLCYACRHHTKAYVHHLVKTKELLASVLLMCHNLAHYFMFFKVLRSAIRTGVYEDWKIAMFFCEGLLNRAGVAPFKMTNKPSVYPKVTMSHSS